MTMFDLSPRFLQSLSVPTLRALWNDLARRLIEQQSAADYEIAVLNRVAITLGEKLGVCVFLTGRDGINGGISHYAS